MADEDYLIQKHWYKLWENAWAHPKCNYVVCTELALLVQNKRDKK